MPIPEKVTLYHEKNLLDRVIDNVAGQEQPLSDSDLNRVTVAAQIQAGIDRYRAQASTLSNQSLFEEEHNSSRLGMHLVESGHPRPSKCHAHAVVAGKHQYAARLRLFMSRLKIRIDDSDNGCWLPENIAATPHPAFPKALPHSRVHRFNYYFWIHSWLIAFSNERDFRNGLQLIARRLQYGGVPPYVMLPKGVGLPKG